MSKVDCITAGSIIGAPLRMAWVELPQLIFLVSKWPIKYIFHIVFLNVLF